MKKNNRKALTVIICVILLLLSTVFTTLAYLTDNDNKAVNTFTVGDVQIELYEYEVDPETGKKKLDNGDPILKKADGSNFTGNENVKLIPGRSVNKEPIIKVLANSEDCYVRAKVTVKATNKTTGFDDWANAFANTYIYCGNNAGFNTQNWTLKEVPIVDTTNKTITYMLYYKNGTDIIVQGEKTLEALFDTIKVPTDLNNAALAELNGMSITIEAHAIQAEGFVADTVAGTTAEDAAWAAFNAQVNP